MSRQKSSVKCIVIVLRSHKEVPWIDPFHVSLSRLVTNFTGDTRFWAECHGLKWIGAERGKH